MLSVLKGEIQACISLLCEGVDPNIISPTGEPLLHLALNVEEESEAVALVQLLLVHGADSNSVNKVTGCSALQVASKTGSSELVSLLKSFGASQQEVISGRGDEGDEGEVVRRFNKYIFDTEQQPDRLNNNGAKFLQQIADLFEENIRGVKSDDSQPASRETEDISQLVSELDKIGFNASSRAARLSKPSLRSEVCSTPRSTQTLALPCLEVSNISSINAEETFYSFLPDQTGDSHITISEEYVIHDR